LTENALFKKVKKLSEPEGVIIAAIDLNVVNTVSRKHEDLASFQAKDTSLQEIIQTATGTVAGGRKIPGKAIHTVL
jgi:hypothetical protein